MNELLEAVQYYIATKACKLAAPTSRACPIKIDNAVKPPVFLLSINKHIDSQIRDVERRGWPYYHVIILVNILKHLLLYNFITAWEQKLLSFGNALFVSWRCFFRHLRNQSWHERLHHDLFFIFISTITDSNTRDITSNSCLRKLYFLLQLPKQTRSAFGNPFLFCRCYLIFGSELTCPLRIRARTPSP